MQFPAAIAAHRNQSKRALIGDEVMPRDGENLVSKVGASMDQFRSLRAGLETLQKTCVVGLDTVAKDLMKVCRGKAPQSKPGPEIFSAQNRRLPVV